MKESMEYKTTSHNPMIFDAEQEYAWAVEPSRPVYPMLATELQGRFSREQWEKAYEAVRHRFPLLSGRIVKHAGERSVLVLSPDPALPFTYAVASGTRTLLEAMKAEASHSFGLGTSYLARLTILESAVSTYLLFSAHHAICDGYTNVSVVRDLLLAVNGQAIGPPFPILPSVGELLGIGPPLQYEKALDQPLASDCGSSQFPPGQMETLRLEPEVLGPLIERTRLKGATIQGVLIAALYMAGRQANPSWQSAPVICLSGRLASAPEARPSAGRVPYHSSDRS